MKVLLLHNYYGSSAPSGENTVFESECAMLRSRGHPVSVFVRKSDEIRNRGVVGVVQGALATPWNPFMARQVRRQVEALQPDVVHAHNTFPLLSPSVFYAVGKRAARVLTLHNYRLFCAAGTPLREERVCTQCLDAHSVVPALYHGCYRHSRVASAPLAASIALHRLLGTWQREVDAFIVFSQFQRAMMIGAGLPAEKVFVKPNFYPGSPRVRDWSERRGNALFVGRLSTEKGIATLLDAWRRWGEGAPELRIAGDGPLRGTLQLQSAGAAKKTVTFLGQLSGECVREEMAQARLLILPSQCYEGFPMVIAEAFAFGTPVAVSDIGALPTIVQEGVNGLVFKVSDPQALLDVVRAAWGNPAELERLGRGARDSFEQHYSEEGNYQMLLEIYKQAQATAK
jgi:glycosyltransferase involved in cell wall biosynthesis